MLDDGDNMRVLPIVTRGPFDNVYDLLYLHGVDAAIVYGDVLDHFKSKPEFANAWRRINYLVNLFPSEAHVFVRPEISSIKDLAGKVVNFNTEGTTAPIPIIFLGIEVKATFVPHNIAMEKMKTGPEVAATFWISSKPLAPFLKGKFPEGFKFLPIEYTDKLEYYAPAYLEHADYPALIPQGQQIAAGRSRRTRERSRMYPSALHGADGTLGAPSLLALLSVPIEELPEQALLLGHNPRRRPCRLRAQLRRIDAARGYDRGFVEPVLQRFEARPARYPGGEVHVFPLLVVAGLLLQLLEALEEILDDAVEPLVAVGILGPVVDGEHGRHREASRFLDPSSDPLRPSPDDASLAAANSRTDRDAGSEEMLQPPTVHPGRRRIRPRDTGHVAGPGCSLET